MALPKVLQKIINNVGYGQTLTGSDNDIVHKSGSEDIFGLKTFNEHIRLNGAPDSNTIFLKSTNNGLYLASGPTNTGTDLSKNATIVLHGGTRSSDPGRFYIHACSPSLGTSSLIGTPEGSLTWNNKDITGDVHTTGNETINGTKTFTSTILGDITGLIKANHFPTNYEMTSSDFSGHHVGIWGADFKAGTTSAPIYNDGDFSILRFYGGNAAYSQFLCASPRRSMLYFGRFWNGVWDRWHQVFTSTQHIRMESTTIMRSVDNEALFICGGTHIDVSPSLALHGKTRSTSPGKFFLTARIDSTAKQLIGDPSGTLTWNGQNIQVSSDERIKTPLSNIPDSVLDAWGDVEWGQFQYLEAVKEKGENARLHLGMIAQKVKKAFEDKGLDACEYGILCHEERPEINEETKIVDCKEYTDENGVFHPEESHIETHHEDAVDLWMVRYTEAQAMEAAYQRRRVSRLEEKIKLLEQKLNLAS